MKQGKAPPIRQTFDDHDILAINRTYPIAAASSLAPGPLQAPGGDQPIAVDVDDYMADANLVELSAVSDVVVHGTIARAESGVQIGDTPDYSYTVFTVNVDETIIGEAADMVQVAMLTHLGSRELLFEGRPSLTVGDEAVLLLTEIAPEFQHDGYVLTNQQGVVAADDQRFTADSAAPVARDLATLGNIDAVREHLRSAAG